MHNVNITATFEKWYKSLSDADRENVLAVLMILKEQGSSLSRPHADTVRGSKYPNMKELRVQSKGKPIRMFFAFDPNRSAILLCGGSKKGKDKRFYTSMISMADKEYEAHLDSL